MSVFTYFFVKQSLDHLEDQVNDYLEKNGIDAEDIIKIEHNTTLLDAMNGDILYTVMLVYKRY
jgi:hypothetical protein